MPYSKGITPCKALKNLIFFIFHMIPDGYQQGKRSKNRQPFQKSKCLPLLSRKNSTWLHAHNGHWKLSSSALQGIWGMVLWCTLVGILVFETPCLFFFFFPLIPDGYLPGILGKRKKFMFVIMCDEAPGGGPYQNWGNARLHLTCAPYSGNVLPLGS